MTKTALQELIEQLREKIRRIEHSLNGTISTEEEQEPKTRMYAFTQCIAMMDIKLPQEREQIEAAYNQSRQDILDGVTGKTPEYTSPSDYYNKTYGE